MVIEIFSVVIILFVLNRYFSGAQYTGPRHSLKGTCAVVTGGNAGIGRQTVLALAQKGCKVFMGARDIEKSKQLVEEVQKKFGPGLVEQYYLDLGDLESIRKFVGQISAEKLQYLINNAGVMTIPKRTLTKSGFQMQYGINHLGHFYLTHLLWGKLNKSSFFRIINVSSLAHKKILGFFGRFKLNFDDMNFEKEKYCPNLAYSRSKLYNVLFTHALAERSPSEKGISVSLHPGVVRTELTRYLISGWKEQMFKLVTPLYSIFTKSPREGAQTTICLIFSPAEKLKNGAFYADCALSSENPLSVSENWNKLWEVSERDLGIKFDTKL